MKEMFLHLSNTWSHPTLSSKMPQVVHDVISQRIMSVQILQLLNVHIQFSECEVPTHALSCNCLVENGLQVLPLLIFNHHVVQDNAAHHDVGDGIQSYCLQGFLTISQRACNTLKAHSTSLRVADYIFM
jgi:hypothetical protein